MSIKRIGNAIQFIVNSVVRWTATIPLGYQRFDLICQPYRDWVPTWPGGVICPKTIIAVNGSDNAVRLGNQITSSGSYNPLFYAVDSDTRNTNTVIGGVSALAYKYDGTAPGAGEVGIDPYMGKSLSAQYTYMTHE